MSTTNVSSAISRPRTRRSPIKAVVLCAALGAAFLLGIGGAPAFASPANGTGGPTVLAPVQPDNGTGGPPVLSDVLPDNGTGGPTVL